MSFLLDTNVLSEFVAMRSSQSVVDWLSAVPADSIHFSTITAGEIEFGIARLLPSRRKSELEAWRDELFQTSASRILPVTALIAGRWADVRARAEAARRTIPLLDALLAATAEVHGLTLVTRNVRDFQAWSGPVLNPWEGD